MQFLVPLQRSSYIAIMRCTELGITAFHTKGPGKQSICLLGQKFLATTYVCYRPWTDRTEQYASKEERIKSNK